MTVATSCDLRPESGPEEGAILVAIGANLPGRDGASPQATCEAALAAMAAAGIAVRRRSSWYATRPVPFDPSQPDYVNGVAEVETALSPAALLAALHAIEDRFGRRRSVPNAARTLDLDLLAFGRLVLDGAGGGPVLPHPRMQDRGFVLVPLAEIMPRWRHPVLGLTAEAMRDALPPGESCRQLSSEPC